MRSRELRNAGAAAGRQFTLAPGVVQLPAALLGRGSQPALTLLEDSLALKFSGVLSPAECAAYTQAVYAAKQDWNSNFGGIQFTLGRAFYVDLEQDQEDQYFHNAAASIELVERAVPGLPGRLAGLVSALLHAPVLQRPGWCSAGVHIFPAGGHCAQHGGDLHFDCEGLTEEQLLSQAPALTCVLMLQPPEQGGELQVWSRVYAGQAEVAREELAEPGLRTALCAYQAGDLVVIDSHRLHQIQPFTGSRDRISATIHAVYVDESETEVDNEAEPEGRWEVWF